MKLHVLASGSHGNATLVENEATGETVLIDCGICKRDFFARSAEAGVNLAKLRGIVITHDHSDHTKGLGVVLRGLAKQGIQPPLLTSKAVRMASKPIMDAANSGLCRVSSFAAGDALSLGGMQVHPFRTSHDAAESFGFRVECGEDAMGFMTDTGIVTPEAHEALGGVRVLAIEANHDPKMLAEGPYPYVIKRRIASDVGHLSNEQSATEVERLLSGKLQHVVAMHISENNNTYRLPGEVLEQAVRRCGHSATVHTAYQNRLVSIS